MRGVTAAASPAPRSKLCRLEQRQADDVGIAAGQEADERRGAALDGIAAGLAAPFAAGQVGVDLPLGQPGEADDALHQPLAAAPVRRTQHDGGHHAVAAAGQQRQAAPRLRLGLGLGQNAPTRGDHGVGGQHVGSRRASQPPPPSRAPGATRAGAAVRRAAGFRRCRREITRSGTMPICASKRQPPRAGGGQNQRGRGHLKRKVIRPLLKS